MIEKMLTDIVRNEFYKIAGKDQHASRKAMHIGFGMKCGNSGDQHQVNHMYIFSPYNYVYVAIQKEIIDKSENRRLDPMEIISCDDSSWHYAIYSWISQNSKEFDCFRPFKYTSEQFDAICLTDEEYHYLENALSWQRNMANGTKSYPVQNPFDNRGILIV